MVSAQLGAQRLGQLVDKYDAGEAPLVIFLVLDALDYDGYYVLALVRQGHALHYLHYLLYNCV